MAPELGLGVLADAGEMDEGAFEHIESISSGKISVIVVRDFVCHIVRAKDTDFLTVNRTTY